MIIAYRHGHITYQCPACLKVKIDMSGEWQPFDVPLPYAQDDTCEKCVQELIERIERQTAPNAMVLPFIEFFERRFSAN